MKSYRNCNDDGVRRRSILSRCIAALLFLPICSTAFASQSDTKTVKVVFEEWPPYQYTFKKRVMGRDVEVVREIFAQLDLKPEFISVPWTKALEHMKTGEADAIFSLMRIPEREPFIAYPRAPISYQTAGVYSRNDAKFQINTMKDLHGKIVEIVRGNSFGPAFDADQSFKRSLSNNQEMMFDKLLARQADVAVANVLVADHLLQKLSLTDRIRMHNLIVIQTPLYLGFSKNHPLRSACPKSTRFSKDDVSSPTRKPGHVI